MAIPSERLPDDTREPSARTFTDLVREGCEDYALKGIGLPAAAYIFHAVKLGLVMLAWTYFVSFTPGLGGLSAIGAWWAAPIAFQKAFLWGLLVEVFGFGERRRSKHGALSTRALRHAAGVR